MPREGKNVIGRLPLLLFARINYPGRSSNSIFPPFIIKDRCVLISECHEHDACDQHPVLSHESQSLIVDTESLPVQR